MTENNVTKWLFILAFAALLAGSIPHVAYIYHFYEANDSGIWGWIVSYSVACSIDILILWLSYIQSNGTLTDVKVVWCFTFALAVLSWYCNWLYDMLHNSAYNGIVWNMSPLDMLASVATVGDLTPKIVSALPLFILAYTYMHRRITNAQLTHTDYRTYADELEATQHQKQRIAAIKRSSRNTVISNLVNDVVAITKNVQSSLAAPSQHVETEQHTNNEHDNVSENPNDEKINIAPSSQDGAVHIDTEKLVTVTASSNGHVAHDDFTSFFDMLKS